MTVNIACPRCDGRTLCPACRNAARALSQGGYLVEHSTRYAALRAAARGAYGFDAAVVPVERGERAVIDASLSLFAGRRLAFVTDDASLEGHAVLPPGVAVLPRAEYENGALDLAWLSAVPTTAEPVADDTVAAPAAAQDLSALRSRAIARLKRVADSARVEIAGDGLLAAPRLDLLAVLDDEIAWALSSGARFAIVVVHLPGISMPKAGERPPDVERRLAAAYGTIAGALRADDVVAWRGDDFLAVLAQIDERGAGLVQARIAAAMTAGDAAGRARKGRGPSTRRIGRALFRDHGTTRDALLAHATATSRPIGAKE